MKHYRILEKKGDQKQYIIQYLKKLFFGLYYWKNLDNQVYNRYEDALNVVKGILSPDDYDTKEIGYHYIDAYKIFKYRDKESVKNGKTTFVPKVEQSSDVNPSQKQVVQKSNKSVFVPKN